MRNDVTTGAGRAPKEAVAFQALKGIDFADAFPGKKFAAHVVERGYRMGRKNVRTDDPTERIDTKILKTVLMLDERAGLVSELRVTGYILPRGAQERKTLPAPRFLDGGDVDLLHGHHG